VFKSISLTVGRVFASVALGFAYLSLTLGFASASHGATGWILTNHTHMLSGTGPAMGQLQPNASTGTVERYCKTTCDAGISAASHRTVTAQALPVPAPATPPEPAIWALAGCTLLAQWALWTVHKLAAWQRAVLLRQRPTQ
jgi:hypothetical protein